MSALEAIDAEAAAHEQDWRIRAVSQLLDANVCISNGLHERAREHLRDVAQAIIDDVLDGGEHE